MTDERNFDWTQALKTAVLAGAADIGRGSSTVLAQVVGEVLGLGLERLSVIANDSRMANRCCRISAWDNELIGGTLVYPYRHEEEPCCVTHSRSSACF